MTRRAYKSRAVQITVNGDPLAGNYFPSDASLRADAFFAENPGRYFCWELVSHTEVRRMDRSLVNFAAHCDYGRYPIRQHLADVHGPGPHSLLFRADWHPRAKFAPAAPSSGCMIFPNFPDVNWGTTDDEQELTGLAWWSAWEMANAPTIRPQFDQRSDHEPSRETALRFVQHWGGETMRSRIGHIAARW